MRCLFQVGLALLLPVQGGAQERLLFGNPERFCRNGAFPGGGEYPGNRPVFQLARVVGPGNAPIPFLGDDDGSADGGGCPHADNPGCKRTTTVRPGDQIVISKTLNGFGCGWHQPTTGRERVGWLPLHHLVIVEHDWNPPLERWYGIWTGLAEPLTLTPGRRPGEIQVEGIAYWPDRRHPYRHIGRLEGSAKPALNTLVIEVATEAEGPPCRAHLTLVGQLLIVNDNHRCGGVNVSFDGVYQRLREPTILPAPQARPRSW